MHFFTKITFIALTIISLISQNAYAYPEAFHRMYKDGYAIDLVADWHEEQSVAATQCFFDRFKRFDAQLTKPCRIVWEFGFSDEACAAAKQDYDTAISALQSGAPSLPLKIMKTLGMLLKKERLNQLSFLEADFMRRANVESYISLWQHKLLHAAHGEPYEPITHDEITHVFKDIGELLRYETVETDSLADDSCDDMVNFNLQATIEEISNKEVKHILRRKYKSMMDTIQAACNTSHESGLTDERAIETLKTLEKALVEDIVELEMLAHTFYDQTQRSIIWAGGAHVDNIVTVLKNLGFHQTVKIITIKGPDKEPIMIEPTLIMDAIEQGPIDDFTVPSQAGPATITPTAPDDAGHPELKRKPDDDGPDKKRMH